MVYTIRENGRKRVVQRLFNDDSINEVRRVRKELETHYYSKYGAENVTVLTDDAEVMMLHSKAKVFCGLIHEWYELVDGLQDRVCGVEEIKQIIPMLSRLCIEAINLPEPEEIEQIPDRIRDKLVSRMPSVRFDKTVSRYWMVLYPYDGLRNKEPLDKPCHCDMEEDIWSVSNDLAEGLKMYETGRVCAALFLWKEFYCEHWGRFHASQALYAMNHICMLDYEEKSR